MPPSAVTATATATAAAAPGSDYGAYVGGGIVAFAAVPPATRRSVAYRAYLADTVATLVAYARRAAPLVDVDAALGGVAAAAVSATASTPPRLPLPLVQPGRRPRWRS